MNQGQIPILPKYYHPAMMVAVSESVRLVAFSEWLLQCKPPRQIPQMELRGLDRARGTPR